MKKKKGNEIHETAIRLLEGQIVFFNSHSIRAVKMPYENDVCMYCDMDSLCTDEEGGFKFVQLCNELEVISRNPYKLVLFEGWKIKR